MEGLLVRDVCDRRVQHQDQGDEQEDKHLHGEVHAMPKEVLVGRVHVPLLPDETVHDGDEGEPAVEHDEEGSAEREGRLRRGMPRCVLGQVMTRRQVYPHPDVLLLAGPGRAHGRPRDGDLAPGLHGEVQLPQEGEAEVVGAPHHHHQDGGDGEGAGADPEIQGRPFARPPPARECKGQGAQQEVDAAGQVEVGDPPHGVLPGRAPGPVEPVVRVLADAADHEEGAPDRVGPVHETELDLVRPVLVHSRRRANLEDERADGVCHGADHRIHIGPLTQLRPAVREEVDHALPLVGVHVDQLQVPGVAPDGVEDRPNAAGAHHHLVAAGPSPEAEGGAEGEE
mmetsp:Transcript_24534/g.64755  ORF Transcript_24534/g.64755 Transcript_24534/m.64755 type:complete len:340 (+) Transcript_24534:224-1243(+)